MVHKKVLKLKLEGNGSYLGRGKGCFIIKHKNGDTEQYPLFTKEIGEAELRDHNSVSTGALISLAQWDIETIITDFNGLPVAILKNLNDDSHVKTRVSQYEVSKNNKGIGIAKQIVLSKIEGQNRARATLYSTQYSERGYASTYLPTWLSLYQVHNYQQDSTNANGYSSIQWTPSLSLVPFSF
jgi:CRISPR/Cas system-associated endonuclease Cas1